MTTTELPAWATAVTVRIPLSPFHAFDHYRRRTRERFERLEQKVADDYVELLGKLDTYLESLRVAAVTPTPVKQRRWRRGHLLADRSKS